MVDEADRRAISTAILLGILWLEWAVWARVAQAIGVGESSILALRGGSGGEWPQILRADLTKRHLLT